MRSFFYAMVLLSLLTVGFFVSSKSLASGDIAAVQAELPYKIVDVSPAGGQKEINGQSQSYDPKVIITDSSITLYPEDKVSAFPDPKLGIGGVITINRAPAISIKDGKKVTIYRSWLKTVGELLAEKNIELGVDDKISQPVDAGVVDGSNITITRVAVTKVIEKKPIDFKIIKKDDPNLDKGKTRVGKAGVKGERQLTYQVTREDGVEVSRSLIENTVTKEPTDQIEYIGTKPVITVHCRFNDTVLAATMKYKQDPNAICNLMMEESNGNPNSDGGQYKGLFQYDVSFWPDAAKKAGFAGAAWSDPTAQIYTTCYLFSVGQSWRW